VDASRISISTSGSDKPLVNENTDEARKENRRVDFIYYF
jgi:outer membrane protein OmpA-like peptidoglycan-associated protein